MWTGIVEWSPADEFERNCRERQLRYEKENAERDRENLLQIERESEEASRKIREKHEKRMEKLQMSEEPRGRGERNAGRQEARKSIKVEEESVSGKSAKGGGKGKGNEMEVALSSRRHVSG